MDVLFGKMEYIHGKDGNWMTDRFIIPGQWHTVAPINYGYQECPSGHRFGPAVRTHYLLHFVFSGCGFLEKDGAVHSLAPGDIFVIHPGEITTYYASRQDPWRYGWIGFTSSAELDFLSTPVLRQPPVRHIFRRLRDCCDKDCPDADVFALTFELLSILSQSNRRSNLSASDYALYAKTHLDNTYMQKVNIAQIANTLHIDRRYLTAVFRKAYGVAPQAYLTQLRLERAKDFLKSGYSVTSAASMSGFSDLCNFSRQFKAHFGYPPSAFQRRS